MGNWSSAVAMRVTIILCLLACVAYEVTAEPQPQPFGLGLLGRLLTAVSSGDKKEGKGGGNEGNQGSGCNCRRKRSFFDGDKKKGNDGNGGDDGSYSAPSGSYGAPSGSYSAPSCDCYSAPSSGYGAPSETYGAPSYGGK